MVPHPPPPPFSLNSIGLSNYYHPGCIPEQSSRMILHFFFFLFFFPQRNFKYAAVCLPRLMKFFFSSPRSVRFVESVPERYTRRHFTSDGRVRRVRARAPARPREVLRAVGGAADDDRRRGFHDRQTRRAVQ